MSLYGCSAADETPLPLPGVSEGANTEATGGVGGAGYAAGSLQELRVPPASSQQPATAQGPQPCDGQRTGCQPHERVWKQICPWSVSGGDRGPNHAVPGLLTQRTPEKKGVPLPASECVLVLRVAVTPCFKTSDPVATPQHLRGLPKSYPPPHTPHWSLPQCKAQAEAGWSLR